MTGDRDRLAAAFEHHRPHLQQVAYAILGSLSEAEDVVQEAWLRLQRQTNAEEIRDLRAWLITTVGRLALDALRSARARREEYVGPWLPEPLVTRIDLVAGASAGAGDDPADRVTLDESISMALLIVLERLSPAERTAFLLHDIFGFTFEQVAEVTGRTATSARKLAERARRHVETGRPRFPPSRAQQLEVVGAFAAACVDGDLEGLIGLLDRDVVWRSDGGGKVNAARRPHRGAEKVARAMLALARQQPAGYIAEVNATPGLVIREPDGTVSVVSLTVDAHRITAIDVVRNPDKLTHVPAV
ncbi:MAG: RNA polymerase sigma factor SigJ [Solirubrobacteraceae bacterium]